jgi:hypothetical protein
MEHSSKVRLYCLEFYVFEVLFDKHLLTRILAYLEKCPSLLASFSYLLFRLLEVAVVVLVKELFGRKGVDLHVL